MEYIRLSTQLIQFDRLKFHNDVDVLKTHMSKDVQGASTSNLKDSRNKGNNNKVSSPKREGMCWLVVRQRTSETQRQTDS
jgi:hypothetical protein